METHFKLVVCIVVGVYIVLLITAPLNINIYTGIVYLLAIIPSTFGHIILRGYFTSLPETRQTIINRLMMMLSYSIHAYMLYTPIIFSIPHFAGHSLISVFDEYYYLLCPLLSLKFLVRSPFILSLLYLYIAKILILLDPMKFINLDHDFWNYVCWVGIVFVNLLDVAVQFLSCDYSGSAPICRWLLKDLFQDFSFDYKSEDLTCPWISIIPNIFLFPLILCVLFILFSRIISNIAFASKLSRILKRKSSSVEPSDIAQLGKERRTNITRPNNNVLSLMSFEVHLNPQQHKATSKNNPFSITIAHGRTAAVKNEVLINASTLVGVESPVSELGRDRSKAEARWYSRNNNTDTHEGLKQSSVKTKAEVCMMHSGQMNTSADDGRSCTEKPDDVGMRRSSTDTNTTSTGRRRGSAEIKFLMNAARTSGINFFASVSGYTTFFISCMMTLLWFIDQYKENLEMELLARVTISVLLATNWLIILSGCEICEYLVRRMKTTFFNVVLQNICPNSEFNMSFI